MLGRPRRALPRAACVGRALPCRAGRSYAVGLAERVGGAAPMSYRYEHHDQYDDYYEERPRRRRTCLLGATILVWALVFACIGFQFFGQPVVTDLVNRRIARMIDPNIAPNADPLNALRDSLARIPSVEIPPGEYVVSEEQADNYLDASRPAGFDDTQVRFVPGEVVTDVTWNGFTGTASMGVEA